MCDAIYKLYGTFLSKSTSASTSTSSFLDHSTSLRTAIHIDTYTSLPHKPKPSLQNAVSKPSTTMERFPRMTTPRVLHDELDATAGASEHDSPSTDQPTPSTTFPPDPHSPNPTATDPAPPEPYNLDDELDLAMARVFKDFLENRGGCTPGVPWQVVEGGFRCGACVGPMVHFLSDEEVDRMESEPGHQPRVVIAREEDK
ncbi:hypothetical protein LTR97_010594 [Elasticomyces elasticus]|uniref:Uncharacterized protein n=1 Tax=Elasticomyces elasticus TaxID=574655 RepID=A0AAN7W382_9PEZI|nr:hypothetical protein LTR97_010594 [Elasticomyces elasticus]